MKQFIIFIIPVLINSVRVPGERCRLPYHTHRTKDAPIRPAHVLGGHHRPFRYTRGATNLWVEICTFSGLHNCRLWPSPVQTNEHFFRQIGSSHAAARRDDGECSLPSRNFNESEMTTGSLPAVGRVERWSSSVIIVVGQSTNIFQLKRMASDTVNEGG